MKDNKPVIVAFMQNMWVKDPVKVQAMIDRHPDKWNWYVKAFLFSGCITGRRIKQAFGEELANSIIYEECTKEIADNPKTICKPDLKHIEWALARIQPKIVIIFGDIAQKAVGKAVNNMGYAAHFSFNAPHPAARQPDTMNKLKAAGDLLKTLIEARHE